MSYAYMNISAEVLRHCLKLPLDADIIGSKDGDGLGIVRILIGHPSIEADAVEVTGRMKTVHGVAVFDGFETTERRKQPCEACGN